MDLSQFDTKRSANDGAWLDLRNPANLSEVLMRDGNPVRIRLLGKDSDAFKKTTARIQNARFKESARGRNAAPLTAEGVEAQTLAVLVACTVEFENVVVDGRELKAPEDTAEFYKRFPAFQEQADSFIDARENFMKAS